MKECLRVWASFVFALMGLWLAFQAASWGRGVGGGEAPRPHSTPFCRWARCAGKAAAQLLRLQQRLHYSITLWFYGAFLSPAFAEGHITPFFALPCLCGFCEYCSGHLHESVGCESETARRLMSEEISGPFWVLCCCSRYGLVYPWRFGLGDSWWECSLAH